VMDIIGGKARLEISKIEKALGKKKAGAVILQMTRQGLLNKTYELSKIKVKPKTGLYIKINPSGVSNAAIFPKQSCFSNILKSLTVRQPGWMYGGKPAVPRQRRWLWKNWDWLF